MTEEDLVEGVGLAIFRCRYPSPEHVAYWPDRLDELVNGPPFDAEGYREMARAAISFMEKTTGPCGKTDDPLSEDRK